MNLGLVKFNADLAKVAEKIDVELSLVVRKIAIEAFKSITELTPVDTGRARASWDMSLGSPSEFLPPDIDPAKRRARRKSKVSKIDPGMEAIGLAQAGKAFDVLARADAKQPLYIISNLPYIEPLEFGHSQKAPAGMVRITVLALEIAVDHFVNPT